MTWIRQRAPGGGRRRTCNCDKFGCLKCMARFLHNHFTTQKRNRGTTNTKPAAQPMRRYEWDRT